MGEELSGRGAGSGRAGGARRRVVTVNGVVGVLARRGGRWVLANDAEVRVVEALRGYGGARERLLALAATLDAGLVAGSQLRRLNRLLGEIASRVACLVWVPDELLGAVAYACACWDHPAGGPWLGWALSARLDGALVRVWLPGPGWQSIGWRDCLADRGFGRETHWISEMPAGFWDLLGSDRSRGLADIAAASDPDTSPRVLVELAEGDRWRSELLDLVASHPRIPKGLLEEMASDPLAVPQVQMRVRAEPQRGTAGAGPAGVQRR